MNRQKIIKRYERSVDHLLSILHDLQDSKEQHYLSSEDLEETAQYLELPYNFVHGVATFYTMFSLKPRGKHIIRICQSPPCHLMGSSNVSKELVKVLGIHFGQTTKDNLFTLEMSSCLGVCGVAPAMMINNQVYGHLSPERIVEVIDGLRRES